MASGRGLRSVLQPVIFVGVASLLHGILFLIPAGGPGKRDSGTTRGVRVKTYIDRPPSAAPPPVPGQALRAEPRAPVPEPPKTVQELQYSALGSATASGQSKDTGIQDSGPRATGYSTAGEGGHSETSSPGRKGLPPQTEWGLYTEKLRSAGVQGWAKESAQKMRQGWKGAGSGKQTHEWVDLSRPGKSGSGKGKAGTGSGADGGVFMDPRVQMVVTSYPATGIENRYTRIRYPDLKFKKHDYTSGWWNVYIEIRTDGNGKIVKCDVLRPETDGPLERQFISQVKREVLNWSYDPKEAEIHVDVRFYVE